MTDLETIHQRRTFAIISHPDAGKTTLTEKLLLYGGAIGLAGTVKSKKSSRHATSDWMELEKQRGISVTTSVMQFPYGNHIINLLDTPGHADFGEDTYRTLTAVDSALMVIDAAKGVEARTIKLMDICRLRNTPILSFINKMDRETRSPIELIDEIESILNIQCTPMTWPIGSGKQFKGIYHFEEKKVYYFDPSKEYTAKNAALITDLNDPKLLDYIDQTLLQETKEAIELIVGTCPAYDHQAFLSGKQTPVLFGSAINSFGIESLLNMFVKKAPPPKTRETTSREIQPTEDAFSGFVFKIQANMDPQHRDRIAFLRIVSGEYKQGMKMFHERTGKKLQIQKALTFMAGQRDNAEHAVAGDIIGLHNHGSIQIGDTFTQGEKIKFLGIPNFAPEIFKQVRLSNPLKQKSLLKGLVQLSEEGATQVFRSSYHNQLILGAVGVLQFDVVKHRLKHEYGVDCIYESCSIRLARWVSAKNDVILKDFLNTEKNQLYYDNADRLCYLAPNPVNLELTIERWPDCVFSDTCEH